MIAAQEISSAAGLRVSVFPNGRYEVTVSPQGWSFSGSIGSAFDEISVATGRDSIGDWQEITLRYQPLRNSAIRIYDSRSIVLFSTQYGEESENTDPFPRFDSYPRGLSTFSYGELWSYVFGGLNRRSPWLFFDSQANAFLISPASNFMTATTRFSDTGAMEAAIDPRILSLPAGFSHRTLLAFGTGINAAFEGWGKALTDLWGKKLPANDSNVVLNKLSYWTDAGAAYYYRPFDPSQYVPLLQQVPDDFTRVSTPISSMELDSWHYPKGRPPSWTNNGSGVDSFQADSSIFPKGLAAFQQTLGLPLIVHTRWIDANSGIRDRYKVSGNVAVDPQYWKDYAKYLSDSGVQVLEQDWLSGPAIADFNLADSDAFLDNMAAAMKAGGLGIVYCMPLWTHIMQSAKYDNVFAARMSNDAFQRERWDEFLFNSRVASAVGLWPFADAFKSPNIKDVLLATLAAGPVGSGDAIGTCDEMNLRRAVRTDGVIVKPDAPIVPTDQTFVAFAQSPFAPVIASTYTDHAGLRTAYVVAYARTPNAGSQIAFSADSIGVPGPAYVYDYFQNAGIVIQPGSQFVDIVDRAGSYYLVAPIGPSGIAFLGDAGKFVSCGKKRIEQLSDNGSLRVTVRFAPGERFLVLRMYSPARPSITAEAGTVDQPQDRGDDLYRFVVYPSSAGTASISISTKPSSRA